MHAQPPPSNAPDAAPTTPDALPPPATSGRIGAAPAHDPATMADLLAATELARDRYAAYLTAVATTAPGRLARRWVRFRDRHPGLARALDAGVRVLTLRWPWWLRPHPLFDRAWYLESNRDVVASRLGPWWHYVRHGAREGRAPNRYFDREWYLRTYPDVRLVGMDPLDHYYRHGCWEGRDPSPRFANDWYLVEHPDVAADGTNPLLHFLRHGVRQGFLPRPAEPWQAVVQRTVPSEVGAGVAMAPHVPVTDAPVAAAPSAARTSPRRTDARALRRLLARTLPASARVGVVHDGDERLLELPGLDAVPVPLGGDGRPASDVPRNDLSAIAHVESLRVTRLDYLVAPERSLWLATVPGLGQHLRARYAALAGPGDAAAVFDLRAPSSPDPASPSLELAAAVREVRERHAREPSVLDWDAAPELLAGVAGASVVRPPAVNGRALAYADRSIDVVLLRDPSPERLAEARRVAASAVVTLTGADAAATASVESLNGARATTALAASVVIPVYNDAAMLTTCLRTFDETVPDWLDAEVIVSDDGSDEAHRASMEDAVARHPRARLVRSDRNGGYIAAVMAGAREATKEVLVLLNNDTVLLPGWLEPLLATLRTRPDAGVVGGMLLYPDGRLQEAGCAIFRDGSATKVGYRDDDPTRPEYAHVRPVDYVSGALLATPRRLFEALGGLDAAYGFGYYEDGDYCFRVRREGREVLYQPASVVVHVEGGTAGLDLTRGAKRYQARNQALFAGRWATELAAHPARPEPLDIHASRALALAGRHTRAKARA
jgi:GT2 family glycosyltransferase